MEELSTSVHRYLSDAKRHVDALIAPFHVEGLDDLSQRISSLAGQLITIGDQAEQENSEQESPLAQGVHFNWIEEAKQVLVLWRDTLFQFQKARILQKEHKIGDQEIFDLHSSSQDVLQKAVQAQSNAFRILEQLVSSAKGARKRLEAWRLLNSPWPIYKEQIADLGRQPDILVKQYQDLLEVTDSMMTIHEQIREIVNRGRNGIDSMLTLAQQAIDSVESQDDAKKLVFELETIEQLIRATPTFENYNDRLDSELMNYNSVLQFPIDTTGGIVQYKDLNPARHIRQWLEGEIHPALNDAIEIIENSTSAFKMALVNVRNRVLLHSQESESKSSINAEELVQSIHDAIEDIRSWRADYKNIRNAIVNRLDASFYGHQVYSGEREFLPLSYTSSLTQLNLEENPLVARARDWVGQKTQFLKEVRSTVLREESLSDAERIIRFVKSRRIQDDQHQYDSIFTAEGYIGESFCIGRQQETEHIVGLINDWRAGFRGAVILHGVRFAGKSLFGEMVAQRHFYNDTIVLKPNITLNAFGRRINLAYDLEEGLEFIDKYSSGRNKLIWIDDLELWNNGDTTIDANVKELLNHIDKHDQRFFYMVSMTSWSMTHFNEMFGLNQGLDASINLNRMSVDEVKEAFAIRHGATHKRLVNQEGEKMMPKEFAKHAAEIYRLSHGNIGEALRLWACASTVVNEEEIHINPLPLHTLPDFIDADKGILLRALLEQKQSNEYRLLKQFGPAFGKRYKVIIQRLLSYGILQRQGNGMLSVFPGVVNEVARILADHGHINIPLAR